MPELTFDTQEAVPEDVRADAVAKDGKFVVNLVSAKKLDEFRNNNVNLSRERDTLQTRFGKLQTELELDPEDIDGFVSTVKDLRTVDQQVKDGKLVKDTSLDSVVEKKTGEMRRAHETQVNALTTANNNLKTENESLKKQVDDNVLVNEVTAAAGDKRSGLRPDALRAVIREAREFFTVREGKLVALDHDGNVIYGADGTTPMQPPEWIKKRLTESSPYLFQESQGGGSQGGSGPGGISQAELQKLSPAERMRLARENQR